MNKKIILLSRILGNKRFKNLYA